MSVFTREAALFIALSVAGAAHADPMVCRTEAGVTHCEAPLNHYRVTGTRKGNRTYFEDNKGRRRTMIEEEGRSTVMPRLTRRVSRPKEFHLRPLSEPDVSLSAHPAPII